MCRKPVQCCGCYVLFVMVPKSSLNFIFNYNVNYDFCACVYRVPIIYIPFISDYVTAEAYFLLYLFQVMTAMLTDLGRI